jgi:hypothetical protein
VTASWYPCECPNAQANHWRHLRETCRTTGCGSVWYRPPHVSEPIRQRSEDVLQLGLSVQHLILHIAKPIRPNQLLAPRRWRIDMNERCLEEVLLRSPPSRADRRESAVTSRCLVHRVLDVCDQGSDGAELFELTVAAVGLADRSEDFDVLSGGR